MSLEQTIGNLEIRYANVVTFVGSSNTMVDTTTGRIQTKGIQHNSNVITDVSGPHGRVAPTLKKYPEIAFESGKFDSNDSTNTYVQAGYTVSASSQDYRSSRSPWCAFDDNNSTHQEFNAAVHLYDGGNGTNPGFATTNAVETTNVDGSGTYRGEWLQIELPNKIKLNKYVLGKRAITYAGIITKEGKVLGSNDGTNWTTVYDHNDTQGPYSTSATIVEKRTFQVNSSSYYKYFRLATNKLFPTGLINNNTMTPNIAEWSLYGYEEDPPAGDHSVDTTFKSRFNNPQLTGVQILVDGATGVGTNQISGGTDPSGNQATYVTDGKYWTLNGTLTSNLSVEANTFLEGDQPHAVSVWFNSSNLEANVSNTCVFSVSDQEKLDSVNLDLQSNTWHNLTYAYQGEGGSRVTYLDGRKVAEDQAEDTFGDYPPFAMTGYSQGGYVASASSEYLTDVNALRNAYKVYNPTTDTAGVWMTEFSTFNPNAVGGDTFTDSDGGTHTGHWNKIELPYKLKPSYFYFKNSGTLTGSRNATNWVILGSNNDSEWDLLHSSTTVLNATKSIPITATKGYTYLMFLCKSVNADTALYMEELRYYGHRENDLVHLPDPTNVLKYPHIAMTGPAQRGYAVTASAEDSANSRYAWKAFNNILPADLSTDFWFSESSRGAYTGGTNGREYVGSSNLGTDSGRTATVDGEWIQVQLPNKIQLTTFNIYGQPNTINNFPASGVLYARNETTEDWTSIYVYNDVTISTNHTQATHTPTTSTFYNTYALSITKKSNSVGGVSVGELELYGTGVDSIPIQIGGGNIDKVANFRVYDKFIGGDQVNEIWNAQKEEFGRAKPQMVLQQGKLGIGTDAPQGSLSVADEPHNLEEFPPRAMTANNTYFEGHGVFKASSSSEYSATYTAFDAFDKITYNDAGVADNAWLSANSSLYASASDYAFTGSATLGNGTVAGEWLKLELPYKIVLKSITLSPRPSSTTHLNQAPEDFKIYGSNDDINWTEVLSETGAAPAIWTGTDFITDTSSTTSYRYFAIVVQKTIGYAGFTAISGLKYFGTREQGQSVLHDGQLTLTKSLNVPRIGPALDADDTPRRDRLVVEYNTSTNPAFEGAVRDTSGRGNDGVFVGTASYNANEKALVFDGNSDYIMGTLNGVSGSALNTSYTISLWVKNLSAANNISVFVFIGTSGSSGGANAVSFRHDGSTTSYTLDNSGVWTFGTMGLPNALNTWRHIVAIFDGTTQKIYVDGVLGGTGTAYGTMNIPNNPTFSIGQRHSGGGTSEYLNGYISNPKIYDTALTAEEVKTLYDMGRTESVANPRPLHISGPVNVMGDIRYITNIRPLPQQTMWSHEANGHFTRGIYPITGTQGGSKVYNMLCEPDWCGGGWMCAAQLPRGKNIVSTTVNLFTDEYGDPSNLAWSNDFAVPMNIFSNNSGYDLDVMLVLLGGRYAGKGGAGGARNGGIYRGVNLTQALNTGWPTNGSYPAYIGTSGLASSIDGFHFVSRSTSGNNFRPYKANSGWRLSFSSHGGYDMAYDDTDIYTMGWLLHTAGNNLNYAYNSVHSAGASQTQSGETSWAAVRFFVRPKRY